MRRCEDSGGEWKLAGGYRFSPYFSAEIEYGDFAERPSLDPLGFEPRGGRLGRGLNLSGAATVPVMKRLDVFGRLGTRQWEQSATGALDLDPSLGDAGVSMQLGAGMSYKFSDRIGFGAEWERREGILGGVGTDVDEDVFSGYLRFRF